jgi:hypothetical protein
MERSDWIRRQQAAVISARAAISSVRTAQVPPFMLPRKAEPSEGGAIRAFLADPGRESGYLPRRPSPPRPRRQRG